MSGSQTILSLEKVSLAGEGYDGEQHGVTFSVTAGEQIFIRSERRLIQMPVMDAAQGLAIPLAGHIQFCGEDWQSMSARRQSVCRGMIGRVYTGTDAWLSNLDVDENVTLRVRHHSVRSFSEIDEEARTLAGELGLTELPAVRPPQVRREVLQACQCVRALLGHPLLLLAEYPFHHLSDDARVRLLDLVDRRCGEGLAVVWLTQNDEMWNRLKSKGRCYYASGESLVEAET